MRISGVLNSRTTCSFNLFDQPPYDLSIEVGEVVTVVDETATTIFAGTIDSISEVIDDSGALRTYRVDCVDYIQIADRHQVAYAYVDPSQNAGDIVKDIVARFFVYGDASYNINVDNVYDGETIEKAVFNYLPASQCFQDLADLCGYIWYIDNSLNLFFGDPSHNVAPFSLTNVSDNWRNMRITETRENYRNRQFIRAGTAETDPMVDSITATTDQKLFEFPFAVSEGISVTENGAPKTLGVNGLDEGKDYYWSYESQVLTAEVAPGNGVVVEFTYRGLFPIIAYEVLSSQITARQALEGGTGIYDAIADDPTLTSHSSSANLALAYLRKYGVIPQVLSFETDTAGLRQGQLLTVNISDLGLNDTYLIESVNMMDVERIINRYKITAVSGEALGGWLEFFTDLSRQKETMRLYDDDIVNQLFKLDETITISDSATRTFGKPESRTDLARTDFSETDWVHP